MNRIIQVLSGSDIIISVACGLLIFTFLLLMGDRIIAFLHRQSLGQRAEVMRYLELMFVEVDIKKVTLAMLVSSFGLGFLVFLVFWPNVGIGGFFATFITVVMWQVPVIFIRARWTNRCKKFVDQMVDGVTAMANGIRAGLSVQQCVERVKENMSNPISQEFGLVVQQMRIGRSMAEALNDLAIRIPEQDVQMFVIAVNILNETGGNLAETFQTIVETIRERQKVQKKIEAFTAQGLMQGIIICCIPLLLLVIFQLVDPTFVAPLFNTALGMAALFVMLILQVVGGIMIKKIITIKV
jgi:tight adherence protein B